MTSTQQWQGYTARQRKYVHEATKGRRKAAVRQAGRWPASKETAAKVSIRWRKVEERLTAAAQQRPVGKEKNTRGGHEATNTTSGLCMDCGTITARDGYVWTVTYKGTGVENLGLPQPL